MSNNLQDLYNQYNGDWRQFFSDVSKFWKEQQAARAPEFEQPHLLGCPWCGVIPVVQRMPAVSPDTFDVICRNLKCPRRIISAKTPEECAKRWNTRVTQ